VIFVSSTNIRRTCKYSSSNYELLNRQVRFAPYSTNIRRIELVRKFDRSPTIKFMESWFIWVIFGLVDKLYGKRRIMYDYLRAIMGLNGGALW
jgi:hypothetical protein